MESIYNMKKIDRIFVQFQESALDDMWYCPSRHQIPARGVQEPKREIFKKFVEFWGVMKQDESLLDILERFVRHDQSNKVVQSELPN